MWLEVGVLVKFYNRARYRGNELLDGKIEAVASTKGTSITVEDLFYTIPSRQSMYLGKESEETKQIVSLLQLFSIHYAPQGISFLLKEFPSRVLFKSPRCSSLEESIAGVLGSAISPTLRSIQIDRENGVECPFSARILLSPKAPMLISPALSFILFVNGRSIQNTRLRQGIRRVLEQYYYCSDSNSRSRNQNQFCYVEMEIDTHLVDVNVHPNKREVCFLDEDYVVKRVVETVEREIDRVLSLQEVGNVTPTKVQNRGDGSGGQSASKKVRVDYSQRTIQFPTQENSILLDESLLSEESTDRANASKLQTPVRRQSHSISAEPSPSQSLMKGKTSVQSMKNEQTVNNNESKLLNNEQSSLNKELSSLNNQQSSLNNELSSLNNQQSSLNNELSLTPSKQSLMNPGQSPKQSPKQSASLPSSLDPLSSSLDPSPSSSPCVPHTQGRRSLAILSDNTIDTPYKPTRDDLQLSSIFSLCEEVRIAGSNCSHTRDILQKSVFIACLEDTSSAVVQFENCLYLFRLTLIL